MQPEPAIVWFLAEDLVVVIDDGDDVQSDSDSAAAVAPSHQPRSSVLWPDSVSLKPDMTWPWPHFAHPPVCFCPIVSITKYIGWAALDGLGLYKCSKRLIIGNWSCLLSIL